MNREKVRLVEFVTNFNIGGTERQVLNLAHGLDPSRFDLHMACLGRAGQLVSEVEAHRTRLGVYPIRSFRSPAAVREQLRFAGWVRGQQVQIVHAYGFYANVFSVPAARLGSAPVVIASIRDIGDWLTPMQRRVQKLVCRAADCVLANSDAVRRKLVEEGYRSEKIAVIRNGIVLDRHDRRAASGRIRQELGIPASARIVAVVSRLNPLKGIEYFLEAAAGLAPRFKDVHFLVVGDGIDPAYRQSLEGLASRLGLDRRVFFTGFRLDVGALLSDVTVSVQPSLSEGLSNVILESMAAARPVVATAVGGNPEAIDDGVSGILVPPRDSAALCKGVARLLEDPFLSERFGRAGRRRVEEHFSIARMVRETEQLYLDLLARSGWHRRRGVA